jgi:hypothetical protein
MQIAQQDDGEDRGVVIGFLGRLALLSAMVFSVLGLYTFGTGDGTRSEHNQPRLRQRQNH